MANSGLQKLIDTPVLSETAERAFDQMAGKPSGLGKIRANYEEKKTEKVKALGHLGELLGKAKTQKEENGIRTQMAKLNEEIEQLKLETDTKAKEYIKTHSSEVRGGSQELDRAQKSLKTAGNEYQKARKSYDEVLKNKGDKGKAEAEVQRASEKVTSNFQTIGEIQRKSGAGFVKELASSTLLTAELGPRTVEREGYVGDKQYSHTDRKARIERQHEIQTSYDLSDIGYAQKIKVPEESKSIVEYREAVAKFHTQRSLGNFKEANKAYELTTVKFQSLSKAEKEYILGHTEKVPTNGNNNATGLKEVSFTASSSSATLVGKKEARQDPVKVFVRAEKKLERLRTKFYSLNRIPNPSPDEVRKATLLRSALDKQEDRNNHLAESLSPAQKEKAEQILNNS